MVQVRDLTKSYGGQMLFESASFVIAPRERIGFVGRNGSGKTTLLRVLAGTEEADSGLIQFPRGYRVGCMEQQLRFTEKNVLLEAMKGLPPERKDDRWRVEKLLSGLGFTSADMDRPVSEFSGGYQIRLNLAKVLAGEPNLLLLDEPTNYLDIVAIRWLERFLREWKGEVLLITHDRAFMDSVCTHTMALHRRKVRKMEGGTEKLYEQVIQEEEVHEKTRLNDEKKRKEIETFITRFRAKARLGGLVQSRVKLLEKSRKLEKLEKIQDLDFEFSALPFASKWLLETEDLSFKWKGMDRPLFQGLNITIRKDDRIAVIGKNGKGKTTLLRLLTGELAPVTGSVKPHPQLTTAYFGQTNIERLSSFRTVEEEMALSSPDHDRAKARAMAGHMMFEGDAMQKKVEVLSGGEKSRVLLGKIILTPAHLLLLDEPTNHLDMQSCDALIEALNSFDGAFVLVTHNEMFLDALANRFIIFDQDKVTVYEGSYRGFLSDIGWESENEEREAESRKADKFNKKDARKARSEIITERSKELKPLETEMKKLEKLIADSEAEHTANTDALIAASSAGNGTEIARLARRNHELTALIEKAYGDLDAATTAYEEKNAVFEKRLQEIE